MKKFVVVLFATAAMFAALAVPAFARNTFADMTNFGTSTSGQGAHSVNCHATAASGADDVSVSGDCE